MPTMLYVVSHGEYSDYSVDTIFSDRAQAEEYMAKFGDTRRLQSFNDIEEMVLDQFVGAKAVYQAHRCVGKEDSVAITRVDSTLAPPRTGHHNYQSKVISWSTAEGWTAEEALAALPVLGGVLVG